jgi:hypothetical protein
LHVHSPLLEESFALVCHASTAAELDKADGQNYSQLADNIDVASEHRTAEQSHVAAHVNALWSLLTLQMWRILRACHS